ncbi:hypothetical protein BDV93DRAFT_551059 [Ceratobasidium sp. AG-I]|nr:hypothetical protein BDV93DRAFT_551059 [Ceratobasidium sp. AG-I]
MIQSSSVPYNARQLTVGQFHGRRAPSIGAPDVVISPQPSASLKRRSHIRRSSRTGTSPTESNFSEAPREPVRPAKPQLSPLITAFVRSTTTSSASASVMTRRPTAAEPSVVEWRDTPRYQPKMTARADVSRRSTIGSVYSLPSAPPHESRQGTQENFIMDWSVVDRALQNRPYAASPSPSHRSHQSVQEHAQRSAVSTSPGYPSRANSRSHGPQVELARTNTAHVHSLLLERWRKHDPIYERLPE